MIEARFRHRQGDFLLDVDLCLPAQGFSVLFGASGSGKSTLLRCLAGLTRPQQGRLVVQGECWQDEDRFLPCHRRAIGLVFQDAALFPHLTVRGNLEYGLRRSGGAGRATLDEAIALFDIGSLLARRPDGLSGGERQRVAMARALALAPRLLLMDEPLAALDAARRAEVLPFLERLQREQRLPVVYVTHALTELQRLADQVLLLDAGRLRAAGPLQQLQTEPGWLQGEEAGVVVEAAVAARDARWQLLRADFDGGSLQLRDEGQAIGSRLRLRIAARDVSLALQEPQDCSVANRLAVRLERLDADPAHGSQCLALLRAGATPLLARLTRQSAERLGLQAGQTLWALVKAVALA